jgi:glycosyltransferase involved in cell wall biosynthesis
MLCSYSDIDYDVLIVEDNSPDGTLQVAKQLQVCEPSMYDDIP